MMSYLLDSNVIAEIIKDAPHRRVIAWLESVNDTDLYLSVVTIGELRKGVEKLTKKALKAKLIRWLEQALPTRFDNRILPVDRLIAERWGRLLAESKRALPAIDSLLAATALHHDLCLVTRHVEDFHVPGLSVFNPWE